jgi:hypothetical protein
MNDETLRELKIVVERAVRPVPASLARKRPMREESLAHLQNLWFTAFLAPIVLTAVARASASEIRYREEWARLEI